MSVVAENAPTKTSVARYWAFTWFPAAAIKPMAGTAGAGEDGAIKIADYTAHALREGFNWPTCAVGPEAECTGLVYQLEECPDTKRVHVQGYAEFSKPCRFQYATGVLGIGGAHCEARKKSREACFAYCTKTETRVAGTCPVQLGSLAECEGEYKGKQGKRTDIAGMVDAIKAGKRAYACLEQDPDTFVKYHRGLAEVRRIVAQHSATKIRKDLAVTVYWGEAGTGKTRRVYDTHGIDNVFTVVADNGACWFDGYEGQDVLLIDDFKGWIAYSMLLKLLDIYPLRLPVKGSYTYAAWTKVYITSNYAPTEWYADPSLDHAALKRRLHTVKRFGTVHGAGLPRQEAASTAEGAGAGGAGAGGAGAGGAAYAPGFSPVALQRSPVTHHVRFTYDPSSDDDSTDNGSDE